MALNTMRRACFALMVIVILEAVAMSVPLQCPNLAMGAQMLPGKVF